MTVTTPKRCTAPCRASQQSPPPPLHGRRSHRFDDVFRRGHDLRGGSEAAQKATLVPAHELKLESVEGALPRQGFPPSDALQGPFQPPGSSERGEAGPGVGAATEHDQPGARGSVFDSDEPVLVQPAELAWAQEPLLRSLAQPVVSAPAGAPAAVVDQIALQLVRRFQVGGNGRASAVRLEFGEGRLQGGSVLVSSEDGQLSIEVDAPAGVDVAGLAERLKRRLEGRGLSVASLECS